MLWGIGRWEKWRDKERSECTDTCTGVSQPPACAKFYIAWSSSDAKNCVICRVSQRIIFWKADEVVEELKVWGGGRRSGRESTVLVVKKREMKLMKACDGMS